MKAVQPKLPMTQRKVTPITFSPMLTISIRIRGQISWYTASQEKPALVFINPQGKPVDWEKHAIFDVADGESPDLKDINGDGKPELLVHSSNPNKLKAANGKGGGQLGYAEIDWKNPLGKAKFRAITPKSPENDEKYFRYTHGYGAGDVNGDGLVDILDKEGWREQPKDATTDKDWAFHPALLHQQTHVVVRLCMRTMSTGMGGTMSSPATMRMVMV